MAGQTPQADVFSAISAAPRRAMMQMLSAGEMPVMELASSFDMTLSAVSQHLSVLRDAGLVAIRRDGKRRLYRLNAEPLQQIAEWLEFYEPFWKTRLTDLGQYLEDNP